MNRFLFYLAFLLLSFSACQSETTTSSLPETATTPSYSFDPKAFPLQEGDLLFQDSDCGPFCEAIEKVTFGVEGAKFSHVGMVVKNTQRKLVVLEAITKGVVETPLDSFFVRSFDAEGDPKVVVGRLKAPHQSLISTAVDSAKIRLGKPYDEVFALNNDRYYCSELIYFAFKEANAGQPIFQLRPMTYKDPDTNQTFPIWMEYFKDLGTFIPENQPGLNPGSMSRSIYLDIVQVYGLPEGMRKELKSH